MGRLEKYALALADGQIESTNDAEDELFFGEAKFAAGGGGEGWVSGLKQLGIDSGVNDVEASGIDLAGGAVVTFGNW